MTAPRPPRLVEEYPEWPRVLPEPPCRTAAILCMVLSVPLCFNLASFFLAYLSVRAGCWAEKALMRGGVHEARARAKEARQYCLVAWIVLGAAALIMVMAVIWLGR